MKFAGQKPIVALAKLINSKIRATTLAMTSEAAIERDALVAKSNALASVQDATTQSLARDVAVEMQERIKAVKAMRKELTRPLDETTASAIAIEREYCAPLLIEIERLKKAVDAFQDEEDDRVEQMEKARTAELKRLDDERIAAEAKLETATPRQTVKLEAVAQEADRQFNELIRSDSAVAIKAAGQSRRMVLTVEVTDKAAAFKAMPHCFDVTPKISVLKACCIPASTANEANPETTLYPGVKCFWSRETSFRST